MELLTNHPNLELVLKLKALDSENFETLCKMHLSFILDLQNDEFSKLLEELPVGDLKNKRGFLHFPKKAKVSKKIMEGAPLTQEGICQIYQLIKYLGRDFNICQEGLFRKSGSLSRQQELKSLLNLGIPLDLDRGQFSVHDCANVLKSFLAELPEPLLSEAHFPLHQQIPSLFPNSTKGTLKKRIKTVQLLFFLLPYENFILLYDLLMLLHQVSLVKAENCLDASGLATLFAPHILFPRMYSPETFHVHFTSLIGAVAFMIENAPSLFEPCKDLLQDIRNHFKNNPSLQLSQEPINTQITFCDRRFALQTEEAQKEYTDKAIAELYAYVHSLPDSNLKNRLIKQFNKENLPAKRPQKKNHLRSKSLGDSIKMHFKRAALRKEIKDDLILNNCIAKENNTSGLSFDNIPSEIKESNTKNSNLSATPLGLDSPRSQTTPFRRTMARASKRMKAAVLAPRFKLAANDN